MKYIECDFYHFLSAKDRFNNILYKDDDCERFCLNVNAIERFYATKVNIENPPYDAELVDAVEINTFNGEQYTVLMEIADFKKLLDDKG